MRISFVMLGLKNYSTGGYYFNFKMASALSKAGHEVDVIHLTTMPKKLRGSRIRGSFYVLKRVLRNRPDLLVVSKSYSFMAPLRLILFTLGYPVLYMVHHLEWHDRAGGVSNLRKNIVRWFLSCGKKIWVNSRSTADDVISLGIPESRLCVIPPGFDRFRTDSEPKQLPVRILSVGTICSRKDQLTLVKACAMLGDRDFHLSILGDETADRDYAEAVRKEADSLGGKVTFTGHLFTEGLYEMYNQSHILANLSHWEGYGIAVAEALWAGLPVLAADAGAVPELITHGDNGYLMAPGDVESCARYLRILIDNGTLRKKMSSNARERARKLFTWCDTGREFVSLAEETAGCKIRRNQSGH
ncbi:MAG: glycosyltransferase family 4 protein [Candidatus Sabulitectum sp.]|nr:glycosyltransferase family 4 protein [Candidatus Sabulitectum sp.]